MRERIDGLAGPSRQLLREGSESMARALAAAWSTRLLSYALGKDSSSLVVPSKRGHEHRQLWSHYL